MRTLSIETPTHGRVLVNDVTNPAGVLVGFHGYGQTAETMMADLERIPGAERWTRIAVQALHRFYGRDSKTIQANWMTSQDRDWAIADNIEYVNRALDAALQIDPAGRWSLPLVFVGFSQGVAMAYRAALLGRHPSVGVIALGSDLPPEFRSGAHNWPRVLLGGGDRDTWYTETKMRADEAALRALGVDLEVIRFEGGHEWAPAFLEAAGRWIGSMGQ